MVNIKSFLESSYYREIKSILETSGELGQKEGVDVFAVGGIVRDLIMGLKSNDIDYDEYLVDVWPTPIPEFDIEKNIFVLRYAYDEYSKIDKFASNNSKFKKWIEGSEWSNYFGGTINSIYVKRRVIVLCSDVGNLIMDDGFSK